MKAICYRQYGSPEVLKLQETPKPAPKAHEVLVNIKAASINSWDWDMIRGKPYIVRLWGLFTPKFQIPGADIAGIVESVGEKVKGFQVGDRVFGDLANSGWGGFAEYKCAPEIALAKIPKEVTFEQAASIPQAGMMALQSICDKGDLKPGQHLLFNGAAGGVGTFAIQLAKSMGAEVTCVDVRDKFDLLKALGADHVIDFTEEDFTANGVKYDLIVDVVANRSLSTYKKSLKKGGKFLMVGGTMKAILQTMVLSKIVSDDDHKLGMMGYEINKDLDYMANMVAQGKLRPIIDKVFSLEETVEAFRYYSSGKVRGKIVIKIS